MTGVGVTRRDGPSKEWWVVESREWVRVILVCCCLSGIIQKQN